MMKNQKQSEFITIDPRRCIACWACIEACPKQVIGKVEFLRHKHIVLRRSDGRIGCMRCVKSCPQEVFSPRRRE